VLWARSTTGVVVSSRDDKKNQYVFDHQPTKFPETQFESFFCKMLKISLVLLFGIYIRNLKTMRIHDESNQQKISLNCDLSYSTLLFTIDKKL
jgi:hypothetical protein